MDKLQFKYNTLNWQKSTFWNPNNPDESWRNKYKDRDVNKGPAFPGSTTILVFLTDGWHLLQFIYLGLIYCGVAVSTQVPKLFSHRKDRTIGNLLFYGMLFRGAYQFGFLVYYT